MKGVLLDKSVYITDTSITRDSMRILLQQTVQITVRYKYKRKKIIRKRLRKAYMLGSHFPNLRSITSFTLLTIEICENVPKRKDRTNVSSCSRSQV